MFNKTKIAAAISAIFLLGAAGVTLAADTTTTGTATANQPLGQAITSVDKNLAKKPDNLGLKKAAQRLERNEARHDAKEIERAHDRAERHERIEKTERAEKGERPEKIARPEKIERPEKVERPEKAERPES